MLELGRPQDREAVNRLARQVHESHVAWRPDIYRSVEALYSEDAFLEAIKARQMYVARLNGLVVGYANITIRPLDRVGMAPRRILYLNELCVEEALRGHGIGTAMMEGIFALGRAFGCTDIQLSVYPQNDDAVGFYQRCGLMIQTIQMQKKL